MIGARNVFGNLPTGWGRRTMDIDDGGTVTRTAAVTKTRTSHFAAFLLLAFALVAAGCSAGSEDSGGALAYDDGQASATTATASEEMAGELQAAPGDGGVGADREALGGGDVAPVANVVQNVGRQIIFTADMTVAVTDVTAAGVEANRIIDSLGGFLFGQQTVGLPEPLSVLTFKVDPDDFHEALSRLGSIGEIRSQNVSADDVTERIVDLESRIKTTEVSVERLQGLIAEATTVAAIADLETQLLDRETQLEVMRGQLRTIRDQVSFATIAVTLTEALSRPQISLAVTGYPGHADAGQSCPGEGGIQVDEGDAATVCFEITNTGDMPLTDIDVADSVLELTLADLTVVFGDPEAAIEPGQFVILAAEIAPERSLRSQTRVTASPVNADGEVLESRRVSTTSTMLVEAVDPGGLPGFGDGVETSLDALKTIGGVAVVVAGVVVPFLWVVALAGLFMWWRRRRNGDEPLVAPTDTVETTG